jgi:hypothetical protein
MSRALTPSVGQSRRRPRDARLYVRLHPSDRALLAERAVARGLAPATYAAVMVRAHLNDLVPLPKEELLALRDVVSRLAGLGRLMNRIADELDRGRWPDHGAREVAEVGQLCVELHGWVMALLIANTKSWRRGYAEGPVQATR